MITPQKLRTQRTNKMRPRYFCIGLSLSLLFFAEPAVCILASSPFVFFDGNNQQNIYNGFLWRSLRALQRQQPSTAAALEKRLIGGTPYFADDPNEISSHWPTTLNRQQQYQFCRHSTFYGRNIDNMQNDVDENFQLVIHGNPTFYAPGASYQVTLQGQRQSPDATYHQLNGFVLRVLPLAGSPSTAAMKKSNRNNDIPLKEAGYFSLLEHTLVKYWQNNCRNIVTNTTTTTTTNNEVHVSWTAPSFDQQNITDDSNSGHCVRFTAAVFSSSSRNMVIIQKDLCQEQLPAVQLGTVDGAEDDEQTAEPAVGITAGDGRCPCDTAKYRIFFDGMWSKSTHPYSFPAEENFVHFSNIIGASHSAQFRLWQMGGRATPGLRKLAMYGITDALEQELKKVPGRNVIHTIIEMDGLWFPEISGGGASRNAIFRADRDRHYVSLASMIGPSPDWLVGIDSVDMCSGNGQWLPSASVMLYPFDAGVDRGETFLSRDEAFDEPIHNLTGPPFYRRDAYGQPIPALPLARVRFQLIRTYPRTCESYANGGNDNSDVDTSSPSGGITDTKLRDMKSSELPVCRVSDWSPWSACLVTCGMPPSTGGTQTRTRQYLNPWKAKVQGCERVLSENQQSCKPNKQELMMPCLPKTVMPTASTISSSAEEMSSTTSKPMMKTPPAILENNVQDADDDDEDTIAPSALPLTSSSSSSSSSNTVIMLSKPCMTSPWSSWSNCTGQCGTTGTMQRTRMLKSPSSDSDCNATVALLETAKCYTACTSSSPTGEEKCALSEWSAWSACSVTCGSGGLQYRSRQFLARTGAAERCRTTHRNIATFEIQNCTQSSCDLNETEAVRACMLPRRPGPCRGYFPRFFYDSERRACLNFVYGGCRGNENNFRTYEECKRNCENRFDVLHGMSLTKLVNLPMASSPDYGRGVDHRPPPPASSYLSSSYNAERFMLKPNVICVDQNQLAPDTIRLLQNDRGFTSAIRHAAGSVAAANGESSSNISKAMMMEKQQQQKLLMMLPVNDASISTAPNTMMAKQSPQPALSQSEEDETDDERNLSVVMHCIVSDWTEWSQCSASCGKGTQFRMRKIIQPAKGVGARACPEELKEMRNCRLQQCREWMPNAATMSADKIMMMKKRRMAANNTEVVAAFEADNSSSSTINTTNFASNASAPRNYDLWSSRFYRQQS